MDKIARHMILRAAIVWLLVPGAAWAAEDGNASYGVADAGASACELVTDMYQVGATATERQFFTWAQGYAAGLAAGRAGGNIPALSPAGEERRQQFQAMLDYCHEHPDASFSEAVENLLR